MTQSNTLNTQVLLRIIAAKRTSGFGHHYHIKVKSHIGIEGNEIVDTWPKRVETLNSVQSHVVLAIWPTKVEHWPVLITLSRQDKRSDCRAHEWQPEARFEGATCVWTCKRLDQPRHVPQTVQCYPA